MRSKATSRARESGRAIPHTIMALCCIELVMTPLRNFLSNAISTHRSHYLVRFLFLLPLWWYRKYLVINITENASDITNEKFISIDAVQHTETRMKKQWPSWPCRKPMNQNMTKERYWGVCVFGALLIHHYFSTQSKSLQQQQMLSNTISCGIWIKRNESHAAREIWARKIRK